MIYDLLLGILLLTLSPKALFKKRKRQHHLRRFFLPKLPQKKFPSAKKVLWIHGVSLGEVRAAQPLIDAIRKRYPEHCLIVSSSTNTGIKAAKSLRGIDRAFLLPFDFSFLMRPLVQKLRPQVLFLIEGDYWRNLLRYTKRAGAQIFLVSGKMSFRSSSRFSYAHFWGKAVFSYFDALLLQNSEYAARFLKAGAIPSRTQIGGNIKYASSLIGIREETRKEWQRRFGISSDDPVLVIASTHKGEESILLEKCSELWKNLPRLKVLLAPRHPERFDEVASEIDRQKIPFLRYTAPQPPNGESLVLIDTTGFLDICFSLADAAVVCGSYIPQIGGHNVLEPNLVGIPTFYGPYMHGQKDLQALVEKAKSGRCVPFEDWVPFFQSFLQSKSAQMQMRNAAKRLKKSLEESLDQTMQHLERFGAFRQNSAAACSNAKKH
ncbi:MAG: glycosyltransferase N-terminal domain-containing protein [Chlamydiota bacterium]